MVTMIGMSKKPYPRRAAVGVALTALLCVAVSVTSATATATTAALKSTNPTNAAISAGQAVVNGVKEVSAIRALVPSSVLKKGSLVDFVAPPYAPLEMYVTGTSTLGGFDIDLAEAITRVLGLRVTMPIVDFPELFTGLRSGRADFVISGASDLPGRRALFTFIDYFETGDLFQTTKSDAKQYHITNGLKSMCGLTVSVQGGTSYVMNVNVASKLFCLEEHKKAISEIDAPSVAPGMLEVETGRAQGVVIEGPEIFGWYQRTNPGSIWVTSGPVLFPNDYGIIFAKGSALVPSFYKAFQLLIRDGVYHRLLKVYGITSGGLAKASISAGPCGCASDLIANMG